MPEMVFLDQEKKIDPENFLWKFIFFALRGSDMSGISEKSSYLSPNPDIFAQKVDFAEIPDISEPLRSKNINFPRKFSGSIFFPGPNTISGIVFRIPIAFPVR